MKRYRVEVRISKDNYFRADCDETELEYYKALCKYDWVKNGGNCYYREFPLTRNKKVFYAKDNPTITLQEISLIINRLKDNIKIDS